MFRFDERLLAASTQKIGLEGATIGDRPGPRGTEQQRIPYLLCKDLGSSPLISSYNARRESDVFSTTPPSPPPTDIEHCIEITSQADM